MHYSLFNGVGDYVTYLWGVYTIEQTSSKLTANVFKIHVLDVCWKFAGRMLLCYNGRASWMFPGRLLDRVNTPLRVNQ